MDFVHSQRKRVQGSSDLYPPGPFHVPETTVSVSGETSKGETVGIVHERVRSFYWSWVRSTRTRPFLLNVLRERVKVKLGKIFFGECHRPEVECGVTDLNKCFGVNGGSLGPFNS